MHQSRPYATVTLYSPIPHPTYPNGTQIPYVPHKIDPRVSGVIAGLVLGVLALACGCRCWCSSRDEKKKRRGEERAWEEAERARELDRLPSYEERQGGVELPGYEEDVLHRERQARLREWLEGNEELWERVRRREWDGGDLGER